MNLQTNAGQKLA